MEIFVYQHLFICSSVQLLNVFVHFSILSDILTKEEFLMKQKIEPIIFSKERQASTYECITPENIEAVAFKVDKEHFRLVGLLQ